MEEEEISCVSGEGLAFAGRHLIYRNLLRFGSRAASSKKYSFTEQLVKVLIESFVLLQAAFWAVTGRMCFARKQITGCDFNETVFKDTVFRRCLLQYANLNGSVLRQVILDETRLGWFQIERMQVQGLQLRAADLTGTNCFKTYFSGTDLTDTKIGGITLSRTLPNCAVALIITPVSAGDEWLAAG